VVGKRGDGPGRASPRTRTATATATTGRPSRRRRSAADDSHNADVPLWRWLPWPIGKKFSLEIGTRLIHWLIDRSRSMEIGSARDEGRGGVVWSGTRRRTKHARRSTGPQPAIAYGPLELRLAIDKRQRPKQGIDPTICDHTHKQKRRMYDSSTPFLIYND
jgi:hypothetical protein